MVGFKVCSITSDLFDPRFCLFRAEYWFCSQKAQEEQRTEKEREALSAEAILRADESGQVGAVSCCINYCLWRLACNFFDFISDPEPCGDNSFTY